MKYTSDDFKITEHVSTLSENEYISIEVNMVSLKDSYPRMDIRKWLKATEKGSLKRPLGGITLYDDEVEKLRDLLNGIELY